MKFLRKLAPLLDRLNYLMAWVAGGLLVYAILSVAYNVFARYFFHSPVVWILEISEYCVLYLVFLGAAFVLQHEGHVRVDLLLNSLSSGQQALLNALTSIVGAAVCLILTIYGVRVTWDAFINHVPTLEFLKAPYFLIVMVIPISSLFLTIQFSRRSAKYWNMRKPLHRDKGNRASAPQD